MERLEAMRDGGQITEEEFRSLRRAALGLDAGAAKADTAVRMADDEANGGSAAGDAPCRPQPRSKNHAPLADSPSSLPRGGDDEENAAQAEGLRADDGSAVEEQQ